MAKVNGAISRHGAPSPIDAAVYLGPDPELALVTADMHAWASAHPCRCGEDAGLCLCNEEDEC
jgi:hypothetical protein